MAFSGLSSGRARRAAVVLVGALALAGCGSDGVGTLSLTDLAKSSSTCPVDLAAAAKSAGVATAGVATGKSFRSGVPAVWKIGGVVAECDVKVARGGDLSLMLVAARKGSAMAVLLPDVVYRAKLPTSDYARLLTTARKTSAGGLVGVPGAEPVAVLVVPLAGAGNAAARLSAEGGPDRTQVEAVAKALGADLS